MKNKVISFLGLLFISLTLSCEIGLGTAPDTETPELNITKPEIAAVIRDAFKLTGTYSDDGEIESVVVDFERTDSEETAVISYKAEIDVETNTWSCLINPKDENKLVPDGNYQVSVTITDTFQHSKTERRQFTIDNTPPIIVLQRPGTKSSVDTTDSYGQTFVLTGQAADDNNIDLIEVYIFDNPECSGEPIHQVSLSNVPLTIELDVAKFGDENYSKIYGTEKVGEKQFFCKIKGYDGAQRYPTDGGNQTPQDLLGNPTEAYYLYSDISESVLGEYKITEVYDMLNGSYISNSSGSNEINTIISLLDENKVQVGKFSLNPANNPTFKIIGYEPLNLDGSDFSSGIFNITNKTSVNVEVSPGLDNISLSKDSLKVYVIECDENGNILENSQKIYLNTERKVSGSSYQFVTKLEEDKEKGFKIGKNYLFGVDGNDIKENTVVSSEENGFGFFFASSGAAPMMILSTAEIIKGDSVSDCLKDSIYYMPKNSKLHLKGTVSQDAGIPILTVMYGDTKIPVEIKLIDEYENIYEFEFTIDETVFNQTESTNQELKIIGENTIKIATEILKTVLYDVESPEIEIISVAPKANKYINENGETDGKQYLNGEISFKASLSDSFDQVKEASWQMIQENNVVKSGNFVSASMESFTIDTTSTEFEDEKPVTIKIIGYDRAGNKSEKSEDYLISQATDVPVILSNNSSLSLEIKNKTDLDSQKNEEEIKNIFTVSGTLNLKIIDDDGIESITTSIAKFENTDFGEYGQVTTSKEGLANKPIETLFSYALPDVSGYYKIKVLVTDKNGKQSDDLEFVIKVTTAAPIVYLTSNVPTITTKADSVSNPISKLNNVLSIESTELPFVIQRYINGSEYGSSFECNSNTFTDNLSLPESYGTGIYKIKYEVFDCNKRKSFSNEANFSIDNENPTIEITKIPNTSETESSVLVFAGNSSEAISSKIKYKLKTADSLTYEGEITPGMNWNLNISVDDENLDSALKNIFATEGAKSIAVQIQDSVGNLSEWIEKEFIYDKANPKINKISYSVDEQNYSEYSSTVSLGKAFTLKIDLFDSYGIESVSIKQKVVENETEDVLDVTELVYLNSDKSELKTGSLPVGEKYYVDGKPLSNEYIYEISVKDKAGKKVSSNKVSILIDTEKPIVSVLTPNVDITDGKLALNGNEENFNISFGDAKGSGVKTLFYEFSQNNAPSNNWTSVETNGSSNYWITKKIGTEEGSLKEGKWYLHAKVVDFASNESNFVTREFLIDKLNPDLVIDKWKTSEKNAVAENGYGILSDEDGKYIELTGTISDTNGLASNPLTIYVDNVPLPTVLSAEGNSSWSQKIYTGTTNGSLLENIPTVVKIVAKDIVGKETVKECTFFYDTKAPEITINNPLENVQIAENKVNIKGTVVEDGFGLESLNFELRNSKNEIIVDDSNQKEISSENYKLIVKGEQWYYAKDSNSEAIPIPLGSKEGKIVLKMIAKESGTGRETTVEQPFFYDKAAPTITETKIGSSISTNSGFSFSGEVADTNALKQITIKDMFVAAGSKDGEEKIVDTIIISEGIQNYSWTQEFNIEDFDDGIHTFTITVEDISGKTAYLQRTITVDKIKPTVTSIKVDESRLAGKDYNGKKYYNSTQIPILVNASDNLNGVGLTNLQYSTVVNPTENDWNTIDKTQNGYSAVVTCSNQGENTISVRGIDGAGNISTTQKLALNIDTEVPENCSIIEEGFNVLSNGVKANNQDSVQVTIDASDSATGISSVKFIKIGNTELQNPISAENEDGKWNLKISANSFNLSGSAVIEVTDGAGNSKEFSLFQITVDKKFPSTTISTPVDADITTDEVDINKTITLRGTATDDHLVGVQVQYRLSSEDEEEDEDEWKNIGELITENIYSWSFEIDTEEFTDNQKYDFRAIATDKAGNIGNSGKDTTAEDKNNYVTLKVNQTSDIPVIRFTNISLGENIILKNSRQITALISDDDGDVKSLKYTCNGEEVTIVPTAGSGYFSTKDISDGEKTILFTVVDSKDAEYSDKVFLTSDGTNKQQGNISLKVDNEAPKVSAIKFYVNDETEGSAELRTLGGIYDRLMISLNAEDDNGIEEVLVSLKKNDKLIEGSEKEASYNPTDDVYKTSELKIGSNWQTTASEKYKIEILVKDNCGLENRSTIDLVIDNESPRITMKSPSQLITEAETITGSVDSAERIYYAITKADATEPSEEADWTIVNNASNAYSITFDGSINPEENKTFLFKDYISQLGIATADEIAKGEYTEITDLNIWIKAIDECGNSSVLCTPVKVDPQGDRPSVTLTYPEKTDTTLGGTIRLVGTATDNISAKYVWIQIDSDQTAGFGVADLTTLKDAGYTIGQISKNEEIDSLSGITDENASDYAIMVPVKGSGWNLTINSNNEFNPTGNESTKNISLTIYATDDDLGNNEKINKSLSISTNIIVDKDSPYFVPTSLKLVQYENGASSGNIIASQSYMDGMSVKGIWYLIGEVRDDGTGIASIHADGKDISASSEKTDKGYKFNIKVGDETTNNVGTSSIEISAKEIKDTNPIEVYKKFSVLFDNRPPVITTNASNKNVSLSSDISNSNGYYSFGAIASEDNVGNIAQTGVERVAVYFTRDLDYKLHESESANTNDLFDSMIYSANDYNKDIASGNMISQYKTSDELKFEDGLYWRKATGKVEDSVVTITDSIPTVHKGRLVKVNGVIYTIVDTSGNSTITLSGEPGNSDNTEILIAVANIINSSGEKNGSSTLVNEEYGNGYYSDSSTDDGDMMIETFTKQGTDWIWDAAINSRNLPDGPINVHIVVFDGAGNIATHEYSGTVRNNTPRIAGIIIGTDENGDNKVDENSEFITTMSNLYSHGYDDTGKNKMTDVIFPSVISSGGATLVKSALTVKGKTVIKPELIGGNGTLRYTYSVFERSGDDWAQEPYYSSNTVKELGEGGTTDKILGLSDIVLEISDFIGTTEDKDSNLIKDAEKQKFSFTIGDSTPGIEEGGISQSAILNVVMDVELREKESATTYIKPFYWKDSNNNSLFENSKLKGHIELPEDIVNNTKITDKRPHVSGKIKLEGIARDNSLLKEIKVAFGSKFGNLDASQKTTIATYNSESSGSGWTYGSALDAVTKEIPSSGWAAEVTQATFLEIINAGYFTLDQIKSIEKYKMYSDEDLYKMNVPYTSQEFGHIVHWIMYIDTEKIENKAQNNVLITATAVDRGTPKYNGAAVSKAKYDSNVEKLSKDVTTGGTDGKDEWGSKYVMNIVPYITEVKTRLSVLDPRNPTVVSRSALGKYPVYDGEKVELKGFNLDEIEYTVNNSGILNYDTNNVPLINNINNNEAKGSFNDELTEMNYASYAYNRLPNNNNNNLLTDDIEFVVWQFDDDAVIPKSGKIEQPIMKINPNNDEVGFAFVNGPLYFSMGGNVTENRKTTHYSYRYWCGSYDFFTSVGFTYDALGNSYGVAAGGDINENQADKFNFFTSRWGRSGSSKDDSYNATKSLRLESIGQIVDKVNTFDKQRIKSPALATAVHGNATNIYLAYYDAMNAEIRFKYGSINSNSKGTFGQFTDQDTDRAVPAYNSQNVQVVAKEGGTNKPGIYVSLAVYSKEVANNVDDVVVMCWYDQTNRQLKYMYNTTPTTIRNGLSTAGWSNAKTIFSGDMANAGEYCKVVVDKDGGIHIAAYDPVNLDLCYAYAESYTSDFSTCVVDSNGVTGSNLTLDVAKVNGKWIPYIGYYATSCIKPKYAYKVDTTSNAPNGSVNQLFTGKWESMIVPTNSVIEMQSNQHNDINIAVWKNEDGEIKEPETTKTTGDNSHPENNNGYNGDAYGHVYGNGTSNPIMGYAIISGASSNKIETAQIK